MSGVRTRDQIEQEYQWDYQSIYANPKDWEADFARIDGLVAPLKELRGKLESPQAVAKAFQLEDELGVLVETLYLYAHMLEDSDTSVGENQARMARIRARYAEIAGELAWIDPEILSKPEETLKQWAEDAALKPYQRSMQLLLRRKPHTLSAEEETLLGLAGDIFSNPYETFGKLTNADLVFPPAKDAEGKEHDVTNGTFYSLLQKRDRTVRENAFGSIYGVYGGHQNMLATTLSGAVKTDVFTARVRKHPGALEASLFKDTVAPQVYTSLIEAVHAALPIFHEYVDLRAEALGLGDGINMWDFYVPLLRDYEVTVEWAQCERWIRASLEPLGPEYMAGVDKSFTERWYDVFENKGKRSGAYSTGAYGQKPFMLLNYHATLNDVFTVAHELGHSMHTFLSNGHQPYRYAHYPIFLAEIASTTNEALLHHFLMETQQEPQFRAYLLNHLLDSFRGTLFRQVMFAEFELEIHRRQERGEPLTAESLKEYYYDLNARYYGPRVKADERIALEWARIPHFYYNFYVYKYATGFIAAQIFYKQVLSGTAGRDQYLGFLRSGSSRDPLDTVRAAGVDLTDPKVLQEAFGTFRDAIRELKGLL